MEADILYHIGLDSKIHDLKEMFGDVKYVCMGGTPHRMEMFAHFLTQELGYKIPSGLCLNDISKNSHRYSMFKLLWHAQVEDAIFFRIGTCGGIGTEPGTVVV